MICADDSQLYIIMRQSNHATASKDLTLYIMSWNVSNIIKCNLKKKLKSFTSRIFHRPNQFLLSRLEILQFLWVMKSKTSRSHFVLYLTFKTHINNICRSASHSIHQIGKIRNFLSRSTTGRLIQAFVSSKLDYCKSILHGLPPIS